jgi:hypothetical protein
MLWLLVHFESRSTKFHQEYKSNSTGHRKWWQMESYFTEIFS